MSFTNSLQPMKIVIIDDHPIIIDGYKSILISQEIEKEENIKLFNSISDAMVYLKLCFDLKETIDLFVIDYNMPPDLKNKIYNGEDLAFHIRTLLPQSKIVILTSIATPILLFEMIHRLQPEGLWLKGDIGVKSFMQYFNYVATGAIVYSDTVKKSFKTVSNYASTIDHHNRKLLLLLNDGVKTKNLPNFLHLSLDTINHRKSHLKEILGLDSCDDVELINKAKSLGLL